MHEYTTPRAKYMRLELVELVERPPAPPCVAGSIPAGGALEVWPCDFGPKQFAWLINTSADRALVYERMP
jgi:hypothetical protein